MSAVAPPSNRNTDKIVVWVIVSLLALAAIVTHAYLVYHPFVVDDTFISLRYAERLVEGHGLTWQDDQRVEGYSNLLWILLTALFGALGANLLESARILGVASTWSVVLAFGYWYYRSRRVRAGAFMATTAAWVGSGAVAAWAIGGMETPLVAGLLAWAIVLSWDRIATGAASLRAWSAPGLALALLCLTRVDGLLFVPLFVLWVLVVGKARAHAWRSAVFLCVLPVVAIAGQEIFRVIYYHDWLPNTARVKFHPGGDKYRDGLRYVAAGFSAVRPLGEFAVVAVIALLGAPRWRAFAGLLLLLMLAWLGYVVVIGGDIFGMHRHMVPFFLMVALAVGLSVGWAERSRLPHLAALMIPILGWFGFTQYIHPSLDPSRDSGWVVNARLAALTFAAGFGERKPTMAVTAAGIIPYLTEFPTVDLLGLNDRHIARSQLVEGGWVGHELADQKYLLDTAPDIIIFGTGAGGPPVHGYAGLDTVRAFRSRYDYCKFASAGLVSTASGLGEGGVVTRAWVNRDSDNVGIHYREQDVQIPPYFLTSNGDAWTWLDEQNRFYVPAETGKTLSVDRIELLPGRWSMDDPGEDVTVALYRDGDEIRAQRDNGAVTFALDDTSSVRVVLQGHSESPPPVYGVTLIRSDR